MIEPHSCLTLCLVELAAIDPLDDPPAPDQERIGFYLRLLSGQPEAHLGLLLLEPVYETGRFKLLDGHHRHRAYQLAGRKWAVAVAIDKPGKVHEGRVRMSGAGSAWMVAAGT